MMATASASDPAHLTAVVIQFRKNRLNHRLLFSAPAFTIRRGWRRELAVFEPEKIFGYERWRANKFGTQDWRLFVCRTCASGPVTKIPGVLPGAAVLLEARGKSQVKRALAAMDDLKLEFGALEKVTLERWRALHNAIQTRRSDRQDRRTA